MILADFYISGIVKVLTDSFSIAVRYVLPASSRCSSMMGDLAPRAFDSMVSFSLLRAWFLYGKSNCTGADAARF